MTVTPLFRHWQVPRNHAPITNLAAMETVTLALPRGKTEMVALNKTRSNTPKTGEYYVNEKSGIYIVPGSVHRLVVTYRPASGPKQELAFEPSPGAAGGETSGDNQPSKGE